MERSKGISTPSSPAGGLVLRLAGVLAFVLAAGFTAADTTTFTFSAANQLTAVQAPSGTMSFTYDGDGQRITKTSASGTAVYVRDSSKGFTHGCVETTTRLFDDLLQYRSEHPNETSLSVWVNYTDATTRGGTSTAARTP